MRTLLLAPVALAVACTTTAPPSERTYVDQGGRIFQLVSLAIENVEGRVIAAVESVGTVQAQFPADVAGLVVYLDVRLERRGFDEVAVHARAHGGREAVDQDVLDRFRTRFFAELDDLAARSNPRVRTRLPQEPGDQPTPAPWPGAPGRG